MWQMCAWATQKGSDQPRLALRRLTFTGTEDDLRIQLLAAFASFAEYVQHTHNVSYYCTELCNFINA